MTINWNKVSDDKLDWLARHYPANATPGMSFDDYAELHATSDELEDEEDE